MASPRLPDLVDFARVQHLIEANYGASGMPAGIVDAETGAILAGAGWQAICTQFHRANPATAERCVASDRYIRSHLRETEPVAYKCLNGLWDIGIPIWVEGQHLATLFLGQFFYEGEQPDRDFFTRQAEQFGFDLTAYLGALDQAPTLSREKVKNTLDYNRAIARFISDLASEKLRWRRELEERHRVEAALRESETRYRGLFEDSPVSLWEQDFSAAKQRLGALRREGVTDFRAYLEAHPEVVTECVNLIRITDVNNATLQIYGAASKAELLSSLNLVIPPEAYDVFRDELVWVSEGQTSFGWQGVNCKLSGERLDIQLRLSAAPGHEDTLSKVFVSIQDITARKKAEAALYELNTQLERRVEERTAQLDAANRELGDINRELNAVNVELNRALRSRDEFLAAMSHELRTPLTGILGLGELLDNGIFGELTDRQHGALRQLQESGDHLLQLINDILDLSKAQAGKVELQLAPVSVTDLCQASLKFIRQMAERKHLKVMFELAGSELVLQADGRRLKQILVNLLVNAVKFTPEGGQIGLAVHSDAPQSQIHFTVWDTGIGIPPEKQPLLFQPFVQLDSSLARKYEGTGLGLALVRSMAELHGGHVALESAGAGQGARFTLTLPWTPEPPALPALRDGAPAKAASVPSLAPILGRPPVILVVDDNPVTLDVLTHFLQAADCQVLAARTGAEALAALAPPARPDVIVLDIQMPEIDGLTALRRLRSIYSAADLPVIALTALAKPEDRERCLAAGANDYLSKPVRLAELGQAISRQLEGRRPTLP